MGNNEDRTGISSEEILQPLDGCDVQMVGRFVQQQYVWFGKQQLAQMHTGLLTAGKLVHGAVEIAFCKAQSFQDTLHAALIAVAVVLFEVMLQGSVFLHLICQSLSGKTAHFVFHFTKICFRLNDFFKNR